VGHDLLVIPIVAAAFAWVVWTLLLPAAARDRLRRLAGRPAAPSKGCGGGCSGCGAAVPFRPAGGRRWKG